MCNRLDLLRFLVACENLLSLPVPEGQKKLWVVVFKGNQYPGWHYELSSAQMREFLIHVMKYRVSDKPNLTAINVSFM